jgi:MerR family transcriptional regulator/heat shock protein HspR
MTKQFWSITEVIERFQIDEGFLAELEEEEIICPLCRQDPQEKLFPVSELEKLRLAKTLFEDMEVNLPGIEVILRMRENMLEMRKQFDAILEDLAQLIHKQLEEGP